MKVSLTACAAVIALAGLASQAHATISSVTATPSTSPTANGLMSTFAGTTTVTFNNSMALPTGFAGGVVVQGNANGQYAAPNGDTTNFYAVGSSPSFTGSATFTPGGTFNYFGLYWGSIDAYNTISFSLAGTNVGTISGSAVPPANGSQTAANTNEFVDFLFSGTGYDKVTFSTSTANFELDNVAFGNVAVPEPASLALLGTGLIGVIGLVRRKKNGHSAAAAA